MNWLPYYWVLGQAGLGTIGCKTVRLGYSFTSDHLIAARSPPFFRQLIIVIYQSIQQSIDHHIYTICNKCNNFTYEDWDECYNFGFKYYFIWDSHIMLNLQRTRLAISIHIRSRIHDKNNRTYQGWDECYILASNIHSKYLTNTQIF